MEKSIGTVLRKNTTYTVYDFQHYNLLFLIALQDDPEDETWELVAKDKDELVVLLNSLRSGPTFVPETENGDKNGDGKIYFIYSKNEKITNLYLY